MSIYPVPIAEWYVEGEAFGDHIGILKSLLDGCVVCDTCGGPIPWETGWVMHAITFGYGEGWCSEKCLNTPKPEIQVIADPTMPDDRAELRLDGKVVGVIENIGKDEP